MEANRVVLIGNPFVGKTAIINYLLRHENTKGYEATIGAACHNYSQRINGEEFCIQIWDTAGQEKYRSLGPIYYRNAKAAIFVYDVTSSDSFEAIPMWLDMFENSVGKRSFRYLVGNKVDLQDPKVDEEIANKFAEENKLTFIQTSAMTGFNINRLFQDIMSQLSDSVTKVETSSLEVKDNKSCC